MPSLSNWYPFKRPSLVPFQRPLTFSPHHHARLASGCWPSVTGEDFHLLGSDERFPSCFLHLFLLSQASWRNVSDFLVTSCNPPQRMP
jgi:hypothetical protein